VPGSIGSVGTNLSSLTVSGTYLDNFSVSLLLRATQASQASSLVNAPRVTLYNGQKAAVAVIRQTSYVSDLDAITANNAVAFNPVPDTIDSGVTMEVQATVSADRKYVTMTLLPVLQSLRDLVPF